MVLRVSITRRGWGEEGRYRRRGRENMVRFKGVRGKVV